MAHPSARNRGGSESPGYRLPGRDEPRALNLVRGEFLEAVRERAPHVVAEFLALKVLATECHKAQGLDRNELQGIPITLLPVEVWREDADDLCRERFGWTRDVWTSVARFRDALLSWAKEYRLDAPWILDIGSTNLAYLEEPWCLPRGGATMRRDLWTRAETVEIALPAYSHTQDPRQWLKEAQALVMRQLTAHVDERKRAFSDEGEPVTRLVQQRLARIRTAAEWQVCDLEWDDFANLRGLRGRDHASLRAVLHSILDEAGVKPRPIPS